MQYLVCFCWVEADGKRTLFAHLNVFHKGMYQVVDENQCKSTFACNGTVINWGVKISHWFKHWLNPNLHTIWKSNPTGFLKHNGVQRNNFTLSLNKQSNPLMLHTSGFVQNMKPHTCHLQEPRWRGESADMGCHRYLHNQRGRSRLNTTSGCCCFTICSCTWAVVVVQFLKCNSGLNRLVTLIGI